MYAGMQDHNKWSLELLKEDRGTVGCVLSVCSCLLSVGKTVTRLPELGRRIFTDVQHARPRYTGSADMYVCALGTLGRS